MTENMVYTSTECENGCKKRLKKKTKTLHLKCNHVFRFHIKKLRWQTFI